MISEFFLGKSILYLSARTFNLEKQIKSKLESLGAHVTFYDERLRDSNWSKAIIRVNKNLLKNRIVKYYKQILKETQNKSFDYMLVIRGEVVPGFFLKRFKELHPSCILIFYNWDSFTNTPNTAGLLHLYDRCLTFDPDDAKKFAINFRPLYFIDEYKTVRQDVPKENDVLFLGTAHSDRYIISNNIKKNIENKGKTMFCYYFIHSKWIYYFKKIFDSTFKYFDIDKISFKSLTLQEIIELYNVSDVILDINHPNQKGLTMRTFEAIGARRKLITTNSEIRKFDFYRSKNIFVLDRNEFKIDLSFLEQPYQDIDKEIYEKLSIEGWLFNLFVDEQKEYWHKFV